MVRSVTEVPRLLQAAPLPEYTFVPGSGTPHPIRDPQGHSYGRKSGAAAGGTKALDPDTWSENRAYLLALDYFNLGLY